MRTGILDREAMAKATTVHRAGSFGAAMLANLHWLRKAHDGSRVRFAGGCVVVCGAGPSLTNQLETVKRLQGDGALVMTVNTAYRAVKAALDPQVLVCIEPVDVSAHMGPAPMTVLDLAAHPNNWAAADGGTKAIVLGDGLQYCRMAAELDLAPIEHDGSAMTAAVGLAARWGAGQIVLAGVDLCIPGEKQYAEGAGWNVTAKLDGERIVYEQPADRIEAHEKAGVEAPPSHRRAYEVTHTDGNRYPASADYVSQAEWLEYFARTVGRGIELTQTEGVRLAGWNGPEKFEVKATPHWQCPVGPAVSQERFEPWLGREEERARHAVSLGQSVLRGTPLSQCHGLWHASDFVEVLAAPESLRATNGQSRADDRIDALCKAFVEHGQRASREIAEHLAWSMGLAG